jgi:hypothetical protein
MIMVMHRALYRFSRPAGQAFGAMGVLLLLLPKVNLVELQNGAAGLRIDDILLASCLMLFAAVRIYYADLRPTKVELAFAGWMVALLASNVVNVTLYGRSNWLYSLRYLEYFLFFYFGYYFAQRHELRSLARAVLWINGPIMVLQMFNLIGGYASAGYARGIDRPIGLTGGPWEIGVLINFCLAIFLFDGWVSKKSGVWALVTTSALLLLTASRMAVLAQLTIVVAFYCRNGHSVFSVLWKSGLAVAVLASVFWFTPNPLRERSQDLFNVENINYLQQIYKQTPDNPSLDGFYDFQAQDDSDLSWVMRVSKWCKAIKMWSHNSTGPIFGIGPGGIGIALDGGWLRIIIETGFLGLTAILALAYSISRISPTLRIMLLAIAVNLLMIDIYLAYKVMAFLFFSAGYFAFRNESACRESHVTIANGRSFTLNKI